MAVILANSPEAVAQAVKLLLGGGIVALPTETVYGLAAHALDGAACEAVFKAKNRPLEDPLICHVLGIEQAQELAYVSPEAETLMEHFWPGPLTLVLPKKPCVPDSITAGLPTVAMRSPSHPLMRKVLEAAGVPLAAPSANPFGYISPTTAAHVAEQLGDVVPLILDGGPCSVGLESTILDLSNLETPRILRSGPILAETLAPFLKKPLLFKKTVVASGPMVAPGLLERHYSPRCPSSLFVDEAPEDARPHACLFFKKPTNFLKRPHRIVDWLTECGDVELAAHCFYAKLRTLDAQNLKHLYLQRIPGDGLAQVLNDRLERAASFKF